MGRKKNREGLTWKHKVGYACGDAGGMIGLTLVSTYLTRYVTNVLGVDYAILSIILMIWNVWDAINDPLMGTIMDKSFAKSKKKDKFRPWILASIPVTVIGLAAFFAVPGMVGSKLVSIAILFVMKVVYELGYTMLNIAMGSMLGVMSTNDGERASLSSARGFGSTIGGMIAMMAVPQILGAVGETTTGYAIVGVVCAVLGGIIAFLHYLWTEERNVTAQAAGTNDDSQQIKVTDILVVFKKNRAYVSLCAHSLFVVFASTIYNQVNAYMYPDVLGDISLATYASMVSLVLTIVALCLAPTLAKKFGLVQTIRTCILTGCIMLAALFAIMMVANPPAIVFMVMSSIGFALVNLSVQMQWGLVGEAIDYNEYATGKRTEGSIYGVFSLFRRIGTTLAQSLAVLMIGWTGYSQELAEAGMTQSDGTITGLKIIGLLIPAIVAMGSWVSFKFIWNINDEVRAKMAAWKAEKKAAAVESAE